MSDNEENGTAVEGFHSGDGGRLGGEIDDHKHSKSQVYICVFSFDLCILCNWAFNFLDLFLFFFGFR